MDYYSNTRVSAPEGAAGPTRVGPRCDEPGRGRGCINVGLCTGIIVRHSAKASLESESPSEAYRSKKASR